MVRPSGKFAEFWSTILFDNPIRRVHAYGGTELVTVTVAGAQDPKLVIANAVRLTFGFDYKDFMVQFIGLTALEVELVTGIATGPVHEVIARQKA
ncbi:hypothetical protein N7486_010435 [Penicillium sp. IBT 16267x]|nr:hypothetical protein N7486_010435 [Penicillium sp. IBT 16267x]